MSSIELANNFTTSEIASANAYCFTIIFPMGRRLYLTSAAEIVEMGGVKYLPYSGMNLTELSANDSAEDVARITGIFEEGGIIYDDNLCGAKIYIGMFLADSIYDIAAYNCTKFEKYDLQFEITAEPLTSRYAADAVLKFSKTCRAVLGDQKCKIDLESLAREFAITEIRDRSIFLSEVKENSGYYTGGIAELLNQGEKIAKFTVVSHTENIITLNKKIDSVLITPHLVLKIYPGCDRKLISCCKKFNNVLNFRGEPFVPEFKILEN